MSLTKVSSGVLNIDDLYGFRNRIINGDMRIAQRGSGPFTASGSFAADRFQASNFTNSLFSAEQVTEAPAGFRNSLKITITTADASPTNNFQFRHKIEGFNVADLNFGAVSASPVTVSFWVRSSLTGNFGFSIRNSAVNRSYNVLYAINAANTWEQKNITIPGDTTGTWLTTNGEGMQLTWSMGAPASSGTPNIWSTASGVGTTGQVNVVSTLNATWQITGVQLELGTVATPFERRPFGAELALCQRYYYKLQATGGNAFFGVGYCDGTIFGYAITSFPVSMRTAPSALEQNGTAGDYRISHSGTNTNCSAVPTFDGAEVFSTRTLFTVASGLTIGRGAFARSTNSSAFLAWSAEL